MSDIIEELCDWIDIANNIQGKGHLMLLNGDIFEAALQEILRYRYALIDVVAIISTLEEYEDRHPEEILLSFLNSQKKQGL